MLGALDARSLCRTAAVSRALYVFAHNGDLWRNLALQQLGGTAPVQFQHSWKDTYARDATRGTAGTTNAVVVRHMPLRVHGIFSDTLFRPWCCCACEYEKNDPPFQSLPNLAPSCSNGSQQCSGRL